MEISGGIDICQMSFPTGATAILLLVCMLSLFSTNCPNNIVLFACCGLTGFLGRISPCFQYSVQSLGRDRFRFISPYTTAHLDKGQKIFPHTDIVLHSANTSEIPATKKPHNYHKIAVWQKDDRIRKSPLKFCVYYYSELEGDCQASIFQSQRGAASNTFNFFRKILKNSAKISGNVFSYTIGGLKASEKENSVLCLYRIGEATP